MYQQSHHHRRRKKRHTQGLRTVEVARGKSGYGFTISGQSPCILSCIVAGSPADYCGLKTGDFLISVNGQNISKAPHDDVVRLIGSSRGLLVLQIAENYNSSDSSEDEYQVRPRSKYPHRSRAKAVPRGAVLERSMDDLALYERHAPQPVGNRYNQRPHRDHSLDYPKSQALPPSPTREYDRRMREARSKGIENVNPLAGGHSKSSLRHKHSSGQGGIIRYRSPSRTKHTIITREARLGLAKSNSHSEGFLPGPSSMPRPLPPAPLSEMEPQANSEPRTNRRAFVYQDDEADDILDLIPEQMRVIIGYAGSIEMPRDSRSSGSRIQSIRGAVRRLRVEQKIHTLVLMEMNRDGLKLVNNLCCTVAHYSSDKVAFAGVCPDDKRFFGLVTLHTRDDFGNDGGVTSAAYAEVIGSSCHVFMVNPELFTHRIHMHRVQNFGIQCTMDPTTQGCLEFRRSAIPIVQCITFLFRSPRHAQYESEMAKIGTFVQIPVTNRRESIGSNSDSGVGDGHHGNQEEVQNHGNRVCVVDLEEGDQLPERSYRSGDGANASMLSEQEASELSSAASSSYLTPGSSFVTHSQPASDASWLSAASGADGQAPSSQSLDENTPIAGGTNTMERLNVRAMPHPRGFSANSSVNIDQNSADNLRKNAAKYLQPWCVDQDPRASTSTFGSSGSAFTSAQVKLDSSAELMPPPPLPPRDAEPQVEVKPVPPIHMPPLHASTPSEKPTPRAFLTKSASKPVPAFIPHVPDPPSTTKPPLPERRPIPQNPRKGPKTPLHPNSLPDRPKSTPPFNKLQETTYSDEECDSDPGTTNGDKRPEQRTSYKTEPVARQVAMETNNDRSSHPPVTLKRSSSLEKPPPPTPQPPRMSASHESLVVSEAEFPSNNNNTCEKWLGKQDSATPTGVTSLSNRGLITARPSDGEVSNIGRVAGWAVSFDRLLGDKAGLATFTEFLKKEYAEENIVFWKKCQDYKAEENPAQREKLGAAIVKEHLSSDASEPVNVDSHARRAAQTAISQGAPQSAFEDSQKHIFTLMKQDSFPRFLKSELYKQCILAEMEKMPLPFTGEEAETGNKALQSGTKLNSQVNNKKSMKKTRSSSNTEEGQGEGKRRRSLLPWNRNKSEKKLKAVTDATLSNGNAATIDTEKIKSELSNLTKTSGAVGASILVHLPDGCRAALPAGRRSGPGGEAAPQSLQEVLSRLCERRGLLLSTLEITGQEGQSVDLSQDATAYTSQHLHLHQCVVFRLDLPSRRALGLKARPGRTLQQVIQPVLQANGVKMDENLVIHVAGTGVILNEDVDISTLSGKHVIAQSLDDFKGKKKREWGGGSQRGSIGKPPLPRGKLSQTDTSKLDPLVQLFRDVGDGNIASMQFDDQGVWDPDKKSGKEEGRNSGLFAFIRRDSFGDKNDKGKVKVNKSRSLTNMKTLQPQPALRPQPQPRAGATGSQRAGGIGADEERFLSLLSKTSRQMDDQRGLTPKDLELPDFLKVEKRHTPQRAERPKSAAGDPYSSKLWRRDLHNSDTSLYESVQEEEFLTRSRSQEGIVLELDTSIQSVGSINSGGLPTPMGTRLPFANESFSQEGVVPSHVEAEEYFSQEALFEKTATADYNDSRLMDKSLQDIGLGPSRESLSSSHDVQYTSGPVPKPRVRPLVPQRQNVDESSECESAHREPRSNMNQTVQGSSEEECDITLIPPSSSSESDSRAVSPSETQRPKAAEGCSRSSSMTSTDSYSNVSQQQDKWRSQHYYQISAHGHLSDDSNSLPDSHSDYHGNHQVNMVTMETDTDVELEFNKIALTDSIEAGVTPRSTPSPTTHSLVLEPEESSPEVLPRQTVHLSIMKKDADATKTKKTLAFDPQEANGDIQVSFV